MMLEKPSWRILMNNKNETQSKETVSALHLLILLYYTKKLGWIEINKKYINWSMYQLIILSHFYSKSLDDPEFVNLIKLYEFVTYSTGPQCNLINEALDRLLLNGYIDDVEKPILTHEGVSVVESKLLKDPLLTSIIEWIDLSVTLQSIYGYTKLFRFIYRDEEFKEKLSSNVSNLDTQNPHNATIKFMGEFKKEYDNQFPSDVGSETTMKDYLIGYFGYIFETIVLGDE